MPPSNLFWQTRGLTQAREDHLTYFLASALECDTAFRESYQERIFLSLAAAGVAPRIALIQTQAVFPSCRPDLLLILDDDRRIACEHKLEAPETLFELDSGEVRGQLERYLELDIDGVAYFRPHLVTLPQEILQHPRYLRPVSQPHFLWRDLYDSLSRGEHVLTQWLLEGFRRLGFTPAAPHVGRLAPDETEDVKENQRNFGKLWHSTGALASRNWKMNTGRRCELYLRPLTSTELYSQVYVSPLAQMGSLLRFRCHTTDAQAGAVCEILRPAVAELPFPSEMTTGRIQNGLSFVDVVVSLYTVLLGADEPEEQERRLFKQIAPLLEALSNTASRRADHLDSPPELTPCESPR
jgi:hypothetical protein